MYMYPARSPERSRTSERQDERFNKLEVETPLVLKSYRRSSKSPVSISRSIPPNRSSIIQNTFKIPQKPEFLHPDCSVLVFGYPKSYKDLVLEKFRKLGNIENIKESSGNWMTLTYSDPLSLSKALAYNFQFISEGVMIGVKLSGVQDVFRENIPLCAQLAEPQSRSQYLKIVPRRKESLYKKFVRYVLNFDID